MWAKTAIISFPDEILVENVTAQDFDESGDLLSETTDVPFSAPALVDLSGGREYSIGSTGKQSHTYSAAIYTPYDERITGKSVIIWDGRRFEATIPTGQGTQKQVMVVLATEVKR